MPQRLVTLDISGNTARYVVVEAGFRSSELTNAGLLERNDGEERDEFLRRVVRTLPQPIDAVHVAAPGVLASTRRLTFPFADPRKIEAALEFELDGMMPYDIEDVVTPWHLVDRTPGQCTLLTSVTRREDLVEQLALLKEVGLETRTFVPPISALAELEPADNHEPMAVVSLGASESHVALVREGLRNGRSLRFGGEILDRYLAERFDLSLEQAQKAKHTEARILDTETDTDGDAKQVSDAVKQGLDPLVTALRSTFLAVPKEEAPLRMLLTGGLSRLPGLAEYFSEVLGLPTDLLDVRAQVSDMECRPDALGPEYSVAVGLMLSVLRRGRSLPLNCRVGDFAYHGDLQFYRGEITRIAVGLTAVILMAITGLVVQYWMISAEEEEIRQGFCDTTRRIAGRAICNPSAAIRYLREPGAAQGVSIPPYSASHHLEMVSKAIGTDVDIKLTELDIRLEPRIDEADRVTLKGEVASFDSVQRIIAQVKRDPCVESTEISKQRKTRNTDRVEFQLGVRVRCPAGILPGQDLDPIAKAAETAEPSSSNLPTNPANRRPNAVSSPPRTFIPER